MPIMSMHDVKQWKQYKSFKWFTLQELCKEAGVELPTKPSFKATEVKKTRKVKKEEDK